MSNYVIGIDLGINNVGWSIVDADSKKLEKAGVRSFTSSNSAEERRGARSVRRRKKRKHNRVKDLLYIFNSIQFPNVNTIDSELLDKRIKGLKEKIEKQDIVNICCYFATHRGYIPFGDEDRKLIKLDGLYPCEYYKKLLDEKGKYRALEDVVDNKDLISELNAILDKQTSYYSELRNIIDDIVAIITRKRKFWEGPGSIDSRTDYGRFKTQEYKDKHGIKEDLKYMYDDLTGKCAICVGEKTAPLANYHYEVFNLLNDFINTSIKSIDNLIDKNAVELDKSKNLYKLTTESLTKVIEYCKSNPKLTYDKIYRELFGLKKTDLDGYRIDKNYKPEFSTMNHYRSFLTAFQDYSIDWIEDIEQYNEVVRILTVSPGIVETRKLIEDAIKDNIIKHEFSDEEYTKLKELSDKLKKTNALRYGSLSEKALIRATKDMLSTCQNFMQVRREFNYDDEAIKHFIDTYTETEGMLLIDTKFIDDIIASPQVKKSLRQAIKVINSIILEKKEYPSVIAVEYTHSVNSDSVSKAIENEQKKNEAKRKQAEEFIMNNFSSSYVTDTNVLKVMLYNELDGRCPYCNKNFKDGINGIINGSIEIEHILPLSKSFNDSYNNKTLSCRDCNSSKGNNIPYLWLGEERFEEFANRIKNLSLPEEKTKNFFETRDLDKYTTRFFNRNLRDTAYATSELINQINIFNDYIKYKLNDEDGIKTLSTPGVLTGNLRKSLGIDKDRDAGKFHHAVDASLVAGIALDDDLGKLLIESQNDKQFWVKKKYLDKTIGDKISNCKNSVIEEDVRKIKSDDDIFISEQVIKDPNKSMANANVCKFLKLESGYKKVDCISDIYSENLMTDKTLPKLFDDNNENYTFMIYDNNRKMYEKLKEIYFNYVDKGNSKNPFVNYCLEVNDIKKEEFDFRKHGIKQENGPVIKKLRYYSKANEPNLLLKKNMKMKDNTFIGLDSVAQVFTQIYWDNDCQKFIFFPIYETSINLNNNSINLNDKTYKLFYDKYLYGKNYSFVVNLYNGTFMEIEKRNGIICGNYRTFNKSNGAIMLKDDSVFTVGDKRLTIYDVDYLGNKKIRLTWPSK